MSDLVLSRNELQILTNAVFRSDRRYVQVSYPFYDLRLFTLDIERPMLKDVVRASEFDKERFRRKPTNRDVGSDEFPRYNELRNCFLSSGFVEYRNEAEIRRKLVELKEDAGNPNKRPRPVFVAVDTNVLYYRFLSRNFPMADDRTGRSVDADDFRYVLSEIVQMEVDSRITHKYSRREINALSKLFAHPELLDEFNNGSGLNERVAKLAFNEMNHLLTDLRALRIKGTPVKGKERNDIEIAQSYKNWARNGDYDVLLLTADEDMVSHARTSELMTLQLEVPFEVPAQARMDPWGVSDLLYDLALTFGVISLDNEGILLFGEWGGKTSSHYQRECVMARFRNDSRHSTVSQQAGLCRKILAQ